MHLDIMRTYHDMFQRLLQFLSHVQKHKVKGICPDSNTIWSKFIPTAKADGTTISQYHFCNLKKVGGTLDANESNNIEEIDMPVGWCTVLLNILCKLSTSIVQ